MVLRATDMLARLERLDRAEAQAEVLSSGGGGGGVLSLSLADLDEFV